MYAGRSISASGWSLRWLITVERRGGDGGGDGDRSRAKEVVEEAEGDKGVERQGEDLLDEPRKREGARMVARSGGAHGS
jgi:hypothetical protein